ncbi:MAG: hypothetical protein PHT52_06220 [Eubacteriales bacterium]|nr:hypothetical protein [Eubacteriales bacterium]MDD4769370.1 hypothetical protein [Eubacteriales bacterium]
MLFGILLLVLAIAMVVLGAWLRMGNVKKRQRLSPEVQDTFLSKEIKNVVANAGGIYISLSLAASFLKLDISQQFALLGIQFDGLAALALVLAILQPLVWSRGS